MSQEDKAIARFAAEHMKAHKKKNIYSLNDEEVLTHRGQTLEEIEKFDDPKSDDEISDDENRSGKLDNKFVGEAHFGGGILSKPESTKSRKDIIDELIAESKKRKAEKQKIREETLDLTEKLDSEWKDLLPIISAANKSTEETIEKTKADDFDIALRELKFEAKGMPTDKLKSEEEIIKEEKERLEALEADRLIRMKGLVNNSSNEIRHKSADDLDDGFALEAVHDEPLVDEENLDKDTQKDSSDEDDKTANDHEDEQSNSVKMNGTVKKKGETENAESEIDENFNEGDSDPEDSTDDDLSDLKESESSSEDENELDKKNNKVVSKEKSSIKPETDADVSQLSDKSRKQEIRDDLLKRKDIMEKAREELPYTFNIPESFEELQELLHNHNADYQSIIIDRIIKCNHWSLNNANKEKLSNLFLLLLQHINDLIFFKLVSLIYPTSDFRHPITTPCLIFMSQILLRSRVKNKIDISKGLFICTLVLEYTAISKRFAPSVINFLRGVIYISTPKHLIQGMKMIPPFKTIGELSNLLVLDDDQTHLDINPSSTLMKANDLVDESLDDEFRITALLTTVNLLREFKNHFEELEAVYSIFEPIIKLLKPNIFDKYPKNVKKHIKQLQKDLKELKNKKLEYIVFQKKKPKALRLYEPRIEVVYDGKRHKPMSKEKAEKEKLLHKYKKEMKGAIREIRRDRAFLAKVQIKQQLKSDEERKRKVKEIFGDAAMQQSELKKFKRKK
ncbi:Nucleolar protein 14 like protein [Habropoda laboriosa]|uniref:Nucleolar protein 14 like protein n=1 Tax=Habropoda laboriosa TaxID=597456 RepID=A0A0L7R2H7_9HYME|nr:Nucleolar protein 14 like protein [Habropoda laboriosa]